MLTRRSTARPAIEVDIKRWMTVRPLAQCNARSVSLDEAIAVYLVTYSEFRNVVYYRLDLGGGLPMLAAKVAQRVWRPVPSFEMSCTDIGPGFVARHGYCTILTAERIGANCFVHHEVTIGWGERGSRPPRVGDDVFIGTGAKVLGAITIGDGVRIGANAVVVTDVPDGCTAVGVPARIIHPSPRSSRPDERPTDDST